MAYLKAKVRNGRLRLDVPSTLPDGAVVELVVVSVGSSEAPESDQHGDFDEAEADTAVGPLLAEEAAWTSLSKPNG
jgi:hypothetical protein